jgi:hypothetical protein
VMMIVVMGHGRQSSHSVLVRHGRHRAGPGN